MSDAPMPVAGSAGVCGMFPQTPREKLTSPVVGETIPADARTTRKIDKAGGEGKGFKTSSNAIDASDTRACDTDRRPYRQVPRDFVERWPAVGWTGAELEWRAHARTIARWVDECGRDRMVLARKNYLAAERDVRSRSRRKRYVLGRTMTPVGTLVGKTPLGSE